MYPPVPVTPVYPIYPQVSVNPVDSLYPQVSVNPVYPIYPHDADHPVYPPVNRQYPPVDPKIFSQSVKSFRLLMDQGSRLLNRLGDQNFDIKIMSAAQQGNKSEVDNLIKSIGLKVPVNITYTPSGITFELTTKPEAGNPQANCCSLTVHLKWGR